MTGQDGRRSPYVHFWAAAVFLRRAATPFTHYLNPQASIRALRAHTQRLPPTPYPYAEHPTIQVVSRPTLLFHIFYLLPTMPSLPVWACLSISPPHPVCLLTYYHILTLPLHPLFFSNNSHCLEEHTSWQHDISILVVVALPLRDDIWTFKLCLSLPSDISNKLYFCTLFWFVALPCFGGDRKDRAGVADMPFGMTVAFV